MGKRSNSWGPYRAPRSYPAFREALSAPGKPQHKPCIECDGSQERFRAFDLPRNPGGQCHEYDAIGEVPTRDTFSESEQRQNGAFVPDFCAKKADRRCFCRLFLGRERRVSEHDVDIYPHFSLQCSAFHTFEVTIQPDSSALAYHHVTTREQ